jgi:hypothetical protein
MKSNLTEIVAFLEKEFPQSLEKCRIESVTERAATVVYQVDERDVRRDCRKFRMETEK